MKPLDRKISKPKIKSLKNYFDQFENLKKYIKFPFYIQIEGLNQKFFLSGAKILQRRVKLLLLESSLFENWVIYFKNKLLINEYIQIILFCGKFKILIIKIAKQKL